jgi:hypothetical protein
MIFFEILLWIVAPAVNFLIWYQIGFQQSPSPLLTKNCLPLSSSSFSPVDAVSSHGHLLVKEPELEFSSIESSSFQKHRGLS